MCVCVFVFTISFIPCSHFDRKGSLWHTQVALGVFSLGYHRIQTWHESVALGGLSLDIIGAPHAVAGMPAGLG